MKYNPALDGIRALAVLAVTALHCEVPFALGGMVGVDVFFVLSGFLITTILRSELAETGDISLRGFYWRRALRLWPPLLLMLAGYSIFAPLVFPEVNVAQDIAVAAFYLSDYAFAFWHVPLNINHTWSLAVEEHFYLVWPLAILATTRLTTRQIIALLIAGFIVATMWRVIDTLVWGDWYRTYYCFDTRLSGLILGSLLAVGTWRPGSSKTAETIGLVSAIILASAMVVLRLKTPHPLLWGGIVVDLAAAGLILSLVSGQTGFGRMLSWPPLVYLGAISYSVYLWHYPIARALRDHLDPVSTFAVVAAVSIGIAALSYEYVEKPLRAFRKSQPAAA